MRLRLLASAGVLGLALAGALLPASPASAHCSGHGNHDDLYSGGGISFGDGTYLRQQPHRSCDANGQGFPRHDINVHCAVETISLWLHVRNLTTDTPGWARFDALRYAHDIHIRDCSGDFAWIITTGAAPPAFAREAPAG